MKEKNMPKLASLKIKIIPLVLAVLALVTLILPYATYSYRTNTYALRGLGILSRASICGGTVTVPSSPFPIVLVTAAIVIILMSVYAVRKPALSFEILTIAAVAGVMACFKMSTSMSNVIPDAKGVTSSYGVILALIVFILILIDGLWELKQYKVLAALDFMCIPGMLYLLINNYIPMFGIYIAFKDVDYSKGLWNSDWVGLTNFKYLFASTDAFIITRNTLLYNAAFIVLGLLTGCIAGICLSELFSKIARKFYQTMILLPQLISMVIVSYIVYGFLSNESGLLTKLVGGDINFYATPKVWPFIIILVYIWKQLGYNAIVFMSSIVGIDRSLYEAGRVDGATKMQQIMRITIPQLKPTIITLFILQVGRIFYSDFGLFYQVPLDAGALYNVTNTVDTYVYRALLVNNNISTAGAASTYQAIVGFAIVFVVNMIIRKVDKENAMF